MADNLCGPSNALKSFSSHVERDRSIHQDRVASPHAAGAAFRSTPAGPSADGDFNVFLHGSQQLGGLPGHAAGLPGHLSSAVPVGHLPSPAPLVGNRPTSVGPSPFSPAPLAHDSPQESAWISEFHGSNQGARAGTPMGNIGVVSPQPFAPIAMNHMPAMAYGPSSYAGAAPLSAAGMYHPNVFSPAIQGQEAFAPQASPAQDAFGGAIAGMSEAELDAKFAEFQAEYEFEDEMEKWMEEHGPTQEERTAAATASEDVEADVDRIIMDIEASHLHGDTKLRVREEAITDSERTEDKEKEAQDELARTAHLIIESVAENTSEKFKNSTFLDLMYRLRAREVVVKDSDLVDVATGKPVSPPETSTGETANGNATTAGERTRQH